MDEFWEQSTSKLTENSPMMKTIDILNDPFVADSHSASTLQTVAFHEQTSPKIFNQSTILLIDDREHLQVKSEIEFLRLMQIGNPHVNCKVVSIFGNAGDGKSHALNETFFNGRKVFDTGNNQQPKTLGVWAAFDPLLNVICLDTQGLNGVVDSVNATNSNRLRLLLKVIAVSDIVIYRSRSERLNCEMYKFLSIASQAYEQFFREQLSKCEESGEAGRHSGGPALVVFHETRFTDVLQSSLSECAEDTIRHTFNEMKLSMESFSSLRYVGICSEKSHDPKAAWYEIKRVTSFLVNEANNRVVRTPASVFRTFKYINQQYTAKGSQNESLNPTRHNLDDYFVCGAQCEICKEKCTRPVGHVLEDTCHTIHDNKACVYSSKYDNQVYYCRKCFNRDKSSIVKIDTMESTDNSRASSWFNLDSLTKLGWSEYRINCPVCGELSRSSHFLYGNVAVNDNIVMKKIVHLWPGSSIQYSNMDNPLTKNAGQKVLDTVTYLSDSIASVGLPPSKVVSSWVADQIVNPAYWRPNNKIEHCHSCKKPFKPKDHKHHCRDCGEGFCDVCSRFRREVPYRGWNAPVRVCEKCFLKTDDASEEGDNQAKIRQYGEVVMSTVSTVVSAVFEYPKDFIKESARPAYWQPDAEADKCNVCMQLFANRFKHHCRQCGKVVCDNCSDNQRAVPDHGWFNPVRICDECLIMRHSKVM